MNFLGRRRHFSQTCKIFVFLFGTSVYFYVIFEKNLFYFSLNFLLYIQYFSDCKQTVLSNIIVLSSKSALIYDSTMNVIYNHNFKIVSQNDYLHFALTYDP